MRRIAFLLCALLWAAFAVWASHAFAQANGVSTFMTPGNQTVPGYVPLQVGPSGVAGGAGMGNAGYPQGATPTVQYTVNTTTGATASTLVTLTGVAGQYTYLCGWNAFTNGGTAQDVSITVNGTAPGTALTYLFSVPAFAATNAAKISDTYQPCIRSQSTGGSISVVMPAQGTGNTEVTMAVWGYTQ